MWWVLLLTDCNDACCTQCCVIVRGERYRGQYSELPASCFQRRCYRKKTLRKWLTLSAGKIDSLLANSESPPSCTEVQVAMDDYIKYSEELEACQGQITDTTASSSLIGMKAQKGHYLLLVWFRCTPSPHSRSSSPHGRSPSPHSRSSSPHVCSSSPHGRSSSPHGRSSSPHRHSSSPHRRSSSPHRHSPSRHTVVRPRHTVVRPRHTAVRPRHTVVRPRHTVVRPRHTVIRPRHITVRPRQSNVLPYLAQCLPLPGPTFVLARVMFSPGWSNVLPCLSHVLPCPYQAKCLSQPGAVDIL